MRARGPQVLRDLRDVPVGAADGVRLGRAQRLRGEQVRLERLARARVADGQDGDEVGRVEQAERDAGLEAERDRGDVAARDRDPAGAGEVLALLGERRVLGRLPAAPGASRSSGIPYGQVPACSER
ncbi:hypothetical protein GCM10025864_40920 [Luteimicrobium album]|uniref:Uncharacterized protein n=1 Tax=Luteimicrobium album TaxID=1054550 RepID=A0ABQ6I8P4_9MICO|nr:hypothetical protein GCM10025864_40920 [Luteimicrobium album]